MSLVLADEAASESRRLEHETVAQVEAVRDRRLDAVQVGERLVEPRVRVAHVLVDGLEAFDIVVRIIQRARRLVLAAQLVNIEEGVDIDVPSRSRDAINRVPRRRDGLNGRYICRNRWW